MCACNALFKDEPSYRCHVNSHHKQICDLICQLQDVTEYTTLVKLDFSLLGDTSARDDWEDVLGSISEQKLRLTKWITLRGLIRHSGKTAKRSQEDYIKTRAQGKKTQALV